MILRQATPVVISFGPFVDKADGVTLKTTLATALDHISTGIMLSRNGGTLSVRHATVTLSTYDAHGCYTVTLDATDTTFSGTLRVIYTDATTILPVWADFQIMNAAEYDALKSGNRTVVASSITAPVDITQAAADKVWGTTARTLTSFGTLAADAATAVWGVLTSALVAAGSIGKRIVDNLDVTVGSRSTYAGADTAGVTTLLSRIPGTVQPQTGDAYARIGVNGAGLTAVSVNSVTVTDKTGYSLAVAPPTAAQIRAEMDSNSTKMDVAVSTRSTYNGADTPGTTTLLGRLTAGRAANLDFLDAAISSIAGLVWGVASRTLTAFGFPVNASNALTAAQTANAIWNEPVASHAAAGSTGKALADGAVAATPVDPVAIAQTLLKLDLTTVSGEADRSVLNALRTLRNKVAVVDGGGGMGIVTVTKEDDTTVAWVAACTFNDSARPITGVDPT